MSQTLRFLVSSAVTALLTLPLDAQSLRSTDKPIAPSRSDTTITAGTAGDTKPTTAQVRPLSTDRPDITESPYTVARGRMQVEVDFFVGSESNAGGVRSSERNFGNVNAKIGLHDRVDLQVVTPIHTRVEARVVGAPGASRVSGSGDVTARLKINVFGNDSGETALAIMPFVSIPNASSGIGSGVVEGGIIVPFGYKLPHGFSGGLMTEVDFVRNDAGPGRAVSIVQSATVSHALFGPVGGFWELVGETAPWHAPGLRALANTGFTVAIGDDYQFDFGAAMGLTSGTDRVRSFVGFSFRR